MVLHDAIVPKYNGVRLPLHPALTAHGVRHFVVQQIQKGFALQLSQLNDLAHKPIIHIQRTVTG